MLRSDHDDSGVSKMAYQLKNESITPPAPDQVEQRSVARDGFAAIVMVLMTVALIALLVSQVVD
jgi:hypothetical protein